MKAGKQRRREREASKADNVDDAKSVENLLAWAGAKSEFELKANLIRLKRHAKALGGPS